MDFLTKSIYVSGGSAQEESKLAGAVLTHFDPEDILSRATQRYVTFEELRDGTGINPQGFMLDASGVLLSDTKARVELIDTLADYVGGVYEAQSSKRPASLIDVVLAGVKCGGSAFVNYQQWIEDNSISPILITMSSFKVSNSSFNIYAPYKASEAEGWKTFSLMDIVEDKAYTWYLCVPVGTSEALNSFAEYMVPVKSHSTSHDVYQVNIPLRHSGGYAGEAFANYLAYNVAYCEMGQKIMREITSDGSLPVREEAPANQVRAVKFPKYNLSIQSSYKTPCINAVLNCGDDMEQLKTLIIGNEEAFITLRWLKRIFSEAENIPGETMQERLSAACVALNYECRTQWLHFALELLGQRYFLITNGFIDLDLSAPMKGGGVNGQSITRITR